MNRALREAIRMERFEELLVGLKKKRLSCEEAALILGCSVRQFHRQRQRFEEEGIIGLRDRRVGRSPSNRAADEEVEALTCLYRERYEGLSVRHFYDLTLCHMAQRRSYSWVRRSLNASGTVQPTKRGGPHRLRRPRKPMRGMMLHQDGSKHRWFGEEYCDLIVTLDDATSEIYSAFFCEEEGTQSTFRALTEVIESQGLFCSLYTDRGGHYFYSMETGKVDKARPTQVGRALRQLHIEHIPAYSPQARGRCERVFGTLQDRLVKELALERITATHEANRYLQEKYLPEHNRRFAVKPASEQSAFLPTHALDLSNILCVQEERIVAHDNTISYHGLRLQLPRHEQYHHFVKATVRIHRYADNTMAVFYGPLCLGHYSESGNQLKNKPNNKENTPMNQIAA